MSCYIELNLQLEGLRTFPIILRQAQDERKNPQALMLFTHSISHRTFLVCVVNVCVGNKVKRRGQAFTANIVEQGNITGVTKILKQANGLNKRPTKILVFSMGSIEE